MTLRIATLNDIPQLVAFSLEAFQRAYGHLYKAEEMNVLLEQYCTPSMCEMWITQPEYFVTILTNEDDEIKGEFVSLSSLYFDGKHFETEMYNILKLSF